MKKILLVVIDGLADIPVEGSTPLRDVKKPNLDWFAANGMVGELELISKRMWTKLAGRSISHLANISLLGYNPKKYEIKRGPLEAIGANIPFTQGHLALRCNFATVDEALNVVDRRAGRNVYGLDEIASYINERVDIAVPYTFSRTYGHRAVLVIRRSISDAISVNDPFKIGEKVKKISATQPDGLLSAKLVQDFVEQSHEILEYHTKNTERLKRGIPPVNYILVRDPGNSLPNLTPKFTEKWKVKALCIAENGVMKATCMLAGFNSLTVPEFYVDGEIDQKKTLDFIFNTMEDALVEYDIVYTHIKPVDEAGHDKDVKKKKRMIRMIDRRIGRFKDDDCVMIITCDHITSVTTGKHEPGRVPLLVHGIGKDKVKTFDEISAKKGKLKDYTPRKLWQLVFKKVR